jgi:hypothetical protein
LKSAQMSPVVRGLVQFVMDAIRRSRRMGLAEASEKGGAHHGDRPWGIVVMSASADPVAGEPTDRCADSELELVEDDVHLISHWALEALSNVECILLDDRSSRGGADSRHESAPLSCQKPISLS